MREHTRLGEQPDESPCAAEIDSREFLVLDASTRDITVGVMSTNGWLASARAGGDALETLFRLTDSALNESGRELHTLDGVLFCAGPGSLLGLRLAAIAVSAWKSLAELARWDLRQYHSLAVVAASRHLAGEEDFHVLSPFRRDQLNHLAVTSGTMSPLDLINVEGLTSLDGTRYFVPNGTLHAAPPEGVTSLPYMLDSLPSVLQAFPELFVPVRQPEVLIPQAPVFAEWSAERHR